MLNRELGADFELDASTTWPAGTRSAWIEMRLRATRPQTAHLPALELDVAFEAGEELRTEISAKFTPERIGAELDEAGLAVATRGPIPPAISCSPLLVPTR